jgi:hypothetical protein
MGAGGNSITTQRYRIFLPLEDVAARALDITGGVGVDHIAEVDFGGNPGSDAALPQDRKRAQTDTAAWTAMPWRILLVAARFPLYETARSLK